ncbi:hypothetical protein [Pseudooceanicola sp.]|uniref:hypothetical protein n=1 Tax=Pseudooceanicola sp. TaxID=1914328 RepID=UPI0026190215|nr:hypothetical protein [Pseudooceanicola sp.]MDF1854192.1 hypothetical protein [Pseudooceanicola sp.]
MRHAIPVLIGLTLGGGLSLWLLPDLFILGLLIGGVTGGIIARRRFGAPEPSEPGEWYDMNEQGYDNPSGSDD